MAHKLDSEKKLWEKAAAFHGHVCPGLTIGYRAALMMFYLRFIGLSGAYYKSICFLCQSTFLR